jgi:hypothetical protein
MRSIGLTRDKTKKMKGKRSYCGNTYSQAYPHKIEYHETEDGGHLTYK